MAITRWAHADFYNDGMTTMHTEIEASGSMLVCSGTNNPADYAAAVAAALATVATPAVALSGASGSDRVMTFAANSTVAIDVSGTATNICITNADTLLFVTPCTSQALVDTGTVDIPEWAITMKQPTAPA